MSQFYSQMPDNFTIAVNGNNPIVIDCCGTLAPYLSLCHCSLNQSAIGFLFIVRFSLLSSSGSFSTLKIYFLFICFFDIKNIYLQPKTKRFGRGSKRINHEPINNPS